MNLRGKAIALLKGPNERDHSLGQRKCSSRKLKKDELTSFLQIVPVSTQSDRKLFVAYACIDNGPKTSFINKNFQDKLPAHGTDFTLYLTGIHGTKDRQTERLLSRHRGCFQWCILMRHLHNLKFHWETQNKTTKN